MAAAEDLEAVRAWLGYEVCDRAGSAPIGNAASDTSSSQVARFSPRGLATFAPTRSSNTRETGAAAALEDR